jgi:hypothetical protein
VVVDLVEIMPYSHVQNVWHSVAATKLQTDKVHFLETQFTLLIIAYGCKTSIEIGNRSS